MSGFFRVSLMQSNFRNLPQGEASSSAAQAHAKFQQALTFHQRGQLLQAQALYEDILRAQPNHADALHLLGLVAAQTKDPKKAVELIDKAIAIKPDYAQAHSDRGIALQELKQLDAAVASFDKAIAIKPDYAEAYYNRGIALSELNILDGALESFNQAIALKPDYAKAYANRGLLLQSLKQFDRALASYELAIAARSDYAEAHFQRAELLLLKGDYLQGWNLYEWRWKTRFRDRKPPLLVEYPLWTGEQNIVGKTILVHPEVGFGDYIMFARYIPQIEQLTARVIVYAPAPLMSLFSMLDQVRVIEQGQPLPHIDLQCPIMSLPAAFKTTLDTIPADVPYLKVPMATQTCWHNKLNKPDKLRIGLMWSGERNRNIDENQLRKRSIPLEYLIPLFDPSFEFHSLQKEIMINDYKTLSVLKSINQHCLELNDFSDTAALIQEMDLVISIDTSVAHLAGALAKPLWVILPYASDYRWMNEGEKTPWYPTARLFRQKIVGGWPDVIQEVRSELLNFQKSLECKLNFEVQL